MKKYFSARGDTGQTDQLGESRLPKDHPRIQAVGALDEASAAIGLARAEAADQAVNQLLQSIQLDLYRIMTLVSLEEPNPDKFPDLEAERVSWLEEGIARYGENLDKPAGFILPGENKVSAALGLARTIVRRAERQVVSLDSQGSLVSKTALPYLNRLSSLCFVLELLAAQDPGLDPGSSR